MSLRRDAEDEFDPEITPEDPLRSPSGRIIEREKAHHQPALEESTSALAESTRGTWRFILLMAALSTLTWGLFVVDAVHAKAVAEEVVAPTKKEIDDHLIQSAEERVRMGEYVKRQDELRAMDRAQHDREIAAINRKLDALCRASAHPEVCLGGN